MAPSKKSRSTSKRFSQVNEVSPNNHGENASRSRGSRKRKLSDMIGPQWGKDELERFYKGYRKHGKDWEKVAVAVRNRSEEMVEALYSMNKAYLSLPKGYASAAGLIAMMTDHYSNMVRLGFSFSRFLKTWFLDLILKYSCGYWLKLVFISFYSNSKFWGRKLVVGSLSDQLSFYSYLGGSAIEDQNFA